MSNPFRKCDYCGNQESRPRRDARFRRRVWTLYAHSRKLACPDCRADAVAEDEQVHRLTVRFGHLLERRLVADGHAGYGMVCEPLEQYRKLKPQFRHSLLVLRDHSGYLMLYRDAEKAAQVLHVDYSGNGAFRIANALLDQVLDKLVAAGHRVAVVIDPVVDDPRHARQTDLWDALASEATEVAANGPEWTAMDAA